MKLPPLSTPGRNDPCPCGSGRKFKQCCAAKWAAEDSARLRLRNAEGGVVNPLLDYAHATWGHELLLDAWDAFFLWPDEPEDIPTTPEFEPMFIPWFVLGYTPDPLDENTQPGWPVTPLGLHWLANAAPRVSPDERAFITTACDSPMSAFVVEAVVPGRSVDLKDILTGRRFHVLEATSSRSFEPGDVTFTRVITIDSTCTMFGTAPYRIPASWQLRIIDWRERLTKKMMTRDDVADRQLEIRELYHDIILELLDPTPPMMRNTDGDPIEWTTMTYALKAPVAEVIDLLAPLATIDGETRMDEEADADGGGGVTTTLTWLKAGNKKLKDWTSTSLGTMRITPGQLVAEVNSGKRAKRLQREIATRLGARAELVKTDVQDLMKALEDRAAQRAAGTLVEEPGPIETPEILAFQDEMFRQHVEQWVDTPVPALGNRTPRQSARTPRGRERVEALLADFEQRPNRGVPNARLHLANLRRTLGMEK